MTEELNRRHNLATMPTINNNGESYIVPFDIYKEGYEAYDISNWFKGRVGDNGTPFGIRWYKHGQLMDVTGMRPFIEGQVGDYTIDDSDPDDPKINMDSEASNVHVVGEVNDCQEYGVAIYRLINQAMPQSGIFYGKIGVMGTQDDGTTVMSSVDIVFKVLAGHMNMLGARKFYVSELEKAWLDMQARFRKYNQEYKDTTSKQAEQFKEDTEKALADLNTKIANEIKRAEDTLSDTQSMIDENIAAAKANASDLQSLADQIHETQNYIKIHDVVTEPEFNDLSRKITDKLSQMKMNYQFVNSSDELKTKFSNGSPDLFISLDNDHQWIYDDDNKTWVDKGSFNFGGVDPKIYDAIYPSSDNLVHDSDFQLMDNNWTLFRDGGNPDWNFLQKTVNKSKIIRLNGFYDSKLSSWNTSLSSKPFNVYGQKSLSMSALTNAHLSGQPQSGNRASISLQFYDAETKQISNKEYPITRNYNDDQLCECKFENIPIPDNAVTAVIMPFICGTGYLEISRIKANYGVSVLPYDLSQLADQLSGNNAFDDPDNLIPDPDFKVLNPWSIKKDAGVPLYDFVDKLGNSKVLKITGNIDSQRNINNTWIETPNFVAKAGKILNLGVLLNIKLNSDRAFVQFQLDCSTQQNSFLKTIRLDLSRNSLDDNLHLFSKSVNLPANTYYVKMRYLAGNDATLTICRPWASQTLSVANTPYLAVKDSNFFTNFDMNWGIEANLANYKTYQLTNDGVSFSGYHDAIGSDKGNYNQKDITNKNLLSLSDATDNVLSFGFLAKVDNPSDKTNICLTAFVMDNNGHSNTYSKWFAPTGNYRWYKFEGLVIKPTESVGFRFIIQDVGTVDIKDFKYTFNTSLEKVESSLPKLLIDSANIQDQWTTAPFKWISDGGSLDGYLQFAIQGDSSRNYPKKNLKIKTFEDAECTQKLKWQPVSSWSPNNKFNLKANWIDATQARNIVNARLVAAAASITQFDNLDMIDKLSETPNLGQMDGYPIEVYLDNGFYGLFTINLKKDEKALGLDSSKTTDEAVSTEMADHAFRDNKSLWSGGLMGTEIHDQASDTLKNNWDKFVAFVQKSTDSEFKSGIRNYIDLPSAINTYLFGVLSREYDFQCRSILYLTWDEGKTFFVNPYDLDSTWGLEWNGSAINADHDWFDFGDDGMHPGLAITQAAGNLLWDKLYRLFKPELKKQYFYLRNSVWSNSNIINAFKKFINDIPAAEYKREQETWSAIPSIKLTSFQQIQSEVIQRGRVVDNFMSHLTDTQPTTPVNDNTGANN